MFRWLALRREAREEEAREARHIERLYRSIQESNERYRENEHSQKGVEYITQNWGVPTSEEIVKYENKCPICYDELDDGRGLWTHKRMHTFHKECIDKWYKKNKNCPMCKLNFGSRRSKRRSHRSRLKKI